MTTGASAGSATAPQLRELCEWAVAARGAALPTRVRLRAAMILCDDIAAMIAAGDEPQIGAARTSLLRAGGPAESTIFAAGLPRASREAVAAANGLAITWAELDEGHRAVPCHAGAYILPALLAEAEADNYSLRDVMTALAVAYEITVRIAQAFLFKSSTVHPHAAFNAIGAAAGLASLRGYSAEALFDTITAAATMTNPGPFNHAFQGALVRNVWTSIGATVGFRAADFAVLGLAGLPTTLEDVFVGAFGCSSHPEALSEGIGDNWAVEGNYHKIFACCQYAHSAVEAALELHRQLGTNRGSTIERIEVETHPHGIQLDVVAPATVLAAKFSLPHIMAAVAVRGSSDASSFATSSLSDTEIAAMRPRVRLSAHQEITAWPNDRPAKVRWIMSDATRLECEVKSARGGADRPFGTEEILEKIYALTRSHCPGMPNLVNLAMADDTTPGPGMNTLRSILNRSA